MKFEDIRIDSKILRKTKDMGFNDLTEIQEKCIPKICDGKDIVGQAETGSGKTVAYVLPILGQISPNNGLQVLVLTPTRELCVQVSDVFRDFGKSLNIKTLSVYGGVSISNQIKNMQYANVVCATPGRMLDHIRRKTIDLRGIKFLVLDEMDKMFEMGFIQDVEHIISYVPKQRQTLMFSATTSYEHKRIISKHLTNPIIIKTKKHVDKNKLKQVYYDICQQNNKFSLLVHLLKHNTKGLSIVFCGTRRESDIVAKNLKRQGINASAIHGGMTQHKRMKSLNSLKYEETEVLIATDVAARGLDIKNVTHVYNYDVPQTSKDYIHRIGRTARAGEYGDAITLLTERDHDNFRRVQSDESLIIEKAEMPQFEKVPFFRNFSKRNKINRYKRFKSQTSS